MNQIRRTLASWKPALIFAAVALCPSARATVILPSNAPTCFLLGSTCSAAAGPLIDLGSGIQGVSFWLNGTPSTTLPQSGGHVILQIFTGGTLNGTIAQGQVLPLGWDFTITTDASQISWTLEFGLGQNALNDLAFTGVNGTSLSSTGTGSMALISAASGAVILEATLDVSYTGGTQMSFTVPSGTSFDFNSVAAAGASVPEPTTFALAGLGLLLVSWRVARR